MPQGHAQPAEARLGHATQFLSADRREALQTWWLAASSGANTPNWDVVSQATIAGGNGPKEGLLLIEAKAHDRELSRGGKPLATNASENSVLNHQHIANAITEANTGLNAITAGWNPDTGWNLSRDSHYQLANRFAWSWKIASLGVPVILVYLGFLGATEMADCGPPLESAADWNQVIENYTRGTVPPQAWRQRIWVPAGEQQIPLTAMTCTHE